VLDRMLSLADLTRVRALLLLEQHELTVSELGAVLRLPQSTTSRHLKVLTDESWIGWRADGPSRHYRMTLSALDPAARRLWTLVREQVADAPETARDAERLRVVLAERRTRSQEFFSTAAGQWDRLRAELFGQRPDLAALLGLLDDDWTVGDLGCGTGQLAAAVAPFVARVIAVDSSRQMLAAARRRLGDVANVELRNGHLEQLPIDDGALDAAVLFLVLHHVAEPTQVLAEAARVVRQGGRLLVVDMVPHEHAEYREQMGHVWQGFSSEQLGDWLAGAGFDRARYQPLSSDPAAKGPALFAATARRKAAAKKVRRSA
jgi:ArsR family transcriptional regulator